MALSNDDPRVQGTLTKLAVTGRNWVQEPAAQFYGGGWSTPLINIKDPRPSIYAQSTSAIPANTAFFVNFGALRSCDVVWFVNFVTSPYATMYIVFSWDTPTFAEIGRIGPIFCWPTDHPGGEADPWGWITTSSARINEATHYAQNRTRIVKIPDGHPGRSATQVAVLITEAAGWPPIRVGCFGVSETAQWEGRYNWQMTFLDESVNTIALSGTTYTDKRRKKRRLNAGFAPIPREQFHGSQGRFYDWLAYKGQSEPFMIMPFFTDLYGNTFDGHNNLEKTGFYGMRSSAPSFTNPFRTYYDLAIQVDEL